MGAQAVILIDHGSRKPAAAATLAEVADMVSALLGLPVYPAHMSLAEPTLEQALAQATAAGAGRVVVFPYFLAEGVHGAGDVPAQAARAAAARPDVEIVLAEPLGADSAIADLVARRIRPHLHWGEQA
jgi:sirohydrochlorin ferrochelatase